VFSFVVVLSSADGATGNAEDVVSVIPYDGFQMYQAERVKTGAERRQADIGQGMMAAEVSRLWLDVTRPLRALLGHGASRDYWGSRANARTGMVPESFDAKWHGGEPGAGRGELIQAGQMLDDGNAGGEQQRVCGPFAVVGVVDVEPVDADEG
jgi:hypothetical protein